MSQGNSNGPSAEGDWQIVPFRRNRKHAQKIPELDPQQQPAPTDTSESDTMPSGEVAASLESTEPHTSGKINTPTFPRAHRRDHIFSSARNQLVEYNRQSLAHFTDPLRVEALTSSATQYVNGESNECTLALVRRKDVNHVQLKLVRGRGAQSPANFLLCLDGGVWKAFDDYLSALKAPKGQIRRGAKGIEQQQAWWSKNGKTFNFLRLPAELHDAVYEHLIPQDIYPISYFENRRPFGRGSDNPMDVINELRKHDSTHKIVPAPNLALTGTCRRLKSEMEHFLMINTVKCFKEPDYLHHFIKKIGNPNVFNNFSQIELDFSHRDYFYFFKVNVQPFPRVNDRFGKVGAPHLAATLRDLPHVKSITLRFTSPFDAMEYDPWGNMGGYRGNLRWYHDWNGNRDRDGFTTSCQKVIVDWILVFAKEYIQHIPEIKLAGAIKTSTKLKWDLIFNDEKAGKQHDMSEQKETISAAEGPPECYCTTSCTNDLYGPINHHKSCLDPGCRCARNARAKYRFWEKELKKYKFDFED